MKPRDFRRLSSALKELTPHQRQILIDRLQPAGQSSAPGQLVETRMTEKPSCPHCAGERVSRWGFANGLQRYRCNTCRATFNALTHTPLAGLRHKAKWIDYAKQLVEGSSIRKSAAAVGIHPNTAFRWRHRFLRLPNGQQASSLAGIAEADETYFLESQKGRRQGLSRAPRQRGGKAGKRGLSEEQVPVLICRDRTGNTADFVLEKADQAHIGAVLKPLLASDVILCTDSAKSLATVAKEMGITHRPVNLTAGQRVVAGVYHVQNVNAYDSRLKEWMRRFHGVATRYLGNYLGWRRLIERHDRNISPADFLRATLGIDRVQHAMGT
ncbi:MAG: IS1595 family transposase [Dechloromonas sp.]|jgi:transposase-like protein|nr:MAG: IS1595 family transposase [Dechloromonas sp.]QLQ25952.1 MAG: IS1595 family transposase [Dechloromonas sp.]